MADRPKHGMDLMIAVAPHHGLPDMHGPGQSDAPEPDADEQGGPSDNDTDDQGAGQTKPEWVDYSTDASNCKNCEYMGDDGNCQVLNIQVGPEDHCKAFSPKGQGSEYGGGEAPSYGGPQG